MKFRFAIILFSCLIGICQQTLCQSFYKEWDNRFGGSMDDSPARMEVTADGGFILGGTSISGISGDKSQPNWDPSLSTSDYWILRTDELGNLLWDRRFGGTNSDVLIKLLITSDDGLIAAGNSFSGQNGDKSQSNWDSTEQSIDFWIVKTDAFGDLLWDKRFGGNSLDLFGSIIQTSDSGYLMVGSTLSSISGNITQPSYGAWDYWIIKIDSIGNKLWDKRFGGIDDDFANSIAAGSNGEFIVGGYSKSGIGGDKSQPSQGLFDYWILKIDSLGNKIWDRTFGGNQTDWLFDLQSTNDGGFLLGGQSFSDLNGDKSEPNNGPSPNSSDRWIIKIDSNGTKLWDRSIGGTASEDLSRISVTHDSGFLLSGESYSNMGGDKSEDNLGLEQTWVVKLDSIGVIIWDKTIYSLGHDEEGSALAIDSNCFVATNYTTADSGGYQSQASRGEGDFWLIKICNQANASSISEGEVSKKLNVYPNPFTRGISIVRPVGLVKNEKIILEIRDITGKSVFIEEMNWEDDLLELKLEGFNKGIYHVRILSEVGSYSVKLIKTD